MPVTLLGQIRRDRDYSLREFADVIGVHTQVLYRLERGETQHPHGKTRRALKAALGLPVETLLSPVNQDRDGGRSSQGQGMTR